MAPIPHSQASMPRRRSYIACSGTLSSIMQGQAWAVWIHSFSLLPFKVPMVHITQRLTRLVCLLAIFCHQDLSFKHKPQEQWFLPPPFQVINRLRINAHLEDTEKNYEQCLGFQDHACHSQQDQPSGKFPSKDCCYYLQHVLVTSNSLIACIQQIITEKLQMLRFWALRTMKFRQNFLWSLNPNDK